VGSPMAMEEKDNTEFLDFEDLDAVQPQQSAISLSSAADEQADAPELNMNPYRDCDTLTEMRSAFRQRIELIQNIVLTSALR